MARKKFKVKLVLPKQPRTDWYPATINPVHPGWYEFAYALIPIPGDMKYWTGQKWMSYSFRTQTMHDFPIYDHDYWRGLAAPAVMPKEKRVRDFLADRSNDLHRHPLEDKLQDNGFSEAVLRNGFVLANGTKISIQQGATHYCDPDSVEMWNCPHLPILDDYGDGHSPYARVPISVAAQYIEQLESRK